jgi:fatty acid desaturase
VIGDLLSRHKDAVCWLHVSLVAGTLLVAVPLLRWTGSAVPTPSLTLLVLGLATLAWGQNIGLVHHFAHHLPRGPRWLGLWTARLLHALGGLGFTRTRFTHRLHHAHLGTGLDPDRIGYESTTTVWRRLRYLVLIGPLRARFAPVDVSQALAAMSPTRRAAFDAACRADRRLIVAAQLVLLGLCGLYYPIVVAALLLANVLSNLREMTEHGDHGRAAFVDIQPSLLGVLFISTPGFWFHGLHHSDATMHYLDLPVASRSKAVNGPLPHLRRRSATAYLFTGR